MTPTATTILKTEPQQPPRFTKKELLVDVDRTIFKTSEFTDILWLAVGKVCGIDGKAELAKHESYHVYLDDNIQQLAIPTKDNKRLRYYDFGAHLQAVTDMDKDEVTLAAQTELSKHNFVYPDAQAILQSIKDRPDLELSFVTFEQDWYQKIKRRQILRVVPEFGQFAWHVIQEYKGPYIARTYAGSQGWLIDDKQEQLPVGYKLLWLQRNQSKTIAEIDGITTINSLKAIKEAIKL